MTHGLASNKHELGRFDKLAELLNKQGFNVLSFDFSGSGESDNAILKVKDQIDDLKYAIKLMRKKGLNQIGLLGYSLGSYVAAQNYDEDVKTIVLWAPATKKLRKIYRGYIKLKFKLIIHNVLVCFLKNPDLPVKRIKRKIRINLKTMTDLQYINQGFLKKIHCPVLIIHGNKDNVVPAEDSIKAMEYLPKNSQLEIIQGASHIFLKFSDKFIKLTLDWFCKQFDDQ